jgi:Acyl-CoA reductase (LuxC)
MSTLLLPSTAPDSAAHLQHVISSGTRVPFDPVVVDFIDAVSKGVLLDPAMRRMPEMMAVAYWMRRAHVLELRQAYERQRGDRVWLARGVVLHFAPSNVDSIFIYSWFISMLLGNSNVVRLSARRGQQVDVLLATIDRLCSEERFQPIAESSLILSYEHDDELTGKLSAACHARVLWGGDDSIRRMRAIPVNPLAIEVAFANRFSLAVLDAATVAEVDDSTLKKLAGRFFNDAYWFDQMACSAPRLVAWVGSAETCRLAQAAFWPALAQEVSRRGVEYDEMIGLNKLVAAYVSAATGLSDHLSPDMTSSVSRIHLTRDAGPEFRRIECGGGLFFELELPRLGDLTSLLTERDQTLSYFGFEREQLKQFALALPTRAVDRIVPVGTALDFSAVWDGSSLFQLLTREVEVC